MTDQDAIDLASLLCSRLCHDMLSPVGALSNGLELLSSEHDPDMRQRCFELLEQSAKVSADKLKFFRLAFGAAGGFCDLGGFAVAFQVGDIDGKTLGAHGRHGPYAGLVAVHSGKQGKAVVADECCCKLRQAVWVDGFGLRFGHGGK